MAERVKNHRVLNFTGISNVVCNGNVVAAKAGPMTISGPYTEFTLDVPGGADVVPIITETRVQAVFECEGDLGLDASKDNRIEFRATLDGRHGDFVLPRATVVNGEAGPGPTRLCLHPDDQNLFARRLHA